ncbi:MAG: hypothetical protein HOH65_10755 [Rhodospirillaceae bacterium]|jgi:hypothetical protein|nr:hypothetical protein [Rhodospirillaceae bacterium]
MVDGGGKGGKETDAEDEGTVAVASSDDQSSDHKPVEDKPVADKPVADKLVNDGPTEAVVAATGRGGRGGGRWGGRVAATVILLIILFGGAFYLCLPERGGPIAIEARPQGAAVAACAVPGLGTPECYARVLVSRATPAEPPRKSRLKSLCCDYVMERTDIRELAIRLDGADWVMPTNGSAKVDAATATVSDGEGFALEGGVVRVVQGGKLTLSLEAKRRSEIAVPLIERFLPNKAEHAAGWLMRSLSLEPAAGAVSIGIAPSLDRKAQTGRAVRISEKGRGGGVPVSVTVDLSPTVLFVDLATNGAEAASLFERLSPEAYPTASELARQLAGSSGQATFASLTGRNLAAAVKILRRFDRAEVSRLSRIESEQAKVLALGEQCIDLYGYLRGALTRFDAAVITFLAAHPTGLLTHRAEAFDHACWSESATELAEELTADWLFLSAPLPILSAAMEPQEKPQATAAAPATSPATPTRALGALVSAAKSGAGRELLSDMLAEKVRVRVGNLAVHEARPKADVLRALTRQWTHAGCWLHASGVGPSVASLHVEAQFPYLNHILLRFGAEGQITTIEITGVTLGELTQEKLVNRGRACQAFLNGARLSDYAALLRPAGYNARTPVDHMARLIEHGPSGKLKLPGLGG